MGDRQLRIASPLHVLLILFGLPFVAVGVGLTVLGLGFLLPGSDVDPLAALLMLPFGLIFAAAGLGFALGRHGVTIDARAGTLTTWGGLGVPMWRRSRPLEGPRAVGLGRERRRGKNNTYTVFPVRLEQTRGPTVTLAEPRSFDQARRWGEQVARLLQVPLHDEASDTRSVREPGQLDESVSDRLRRKGGRLEAPRRPADCRIAWDQRGTTVVLDLPGSGLPLLQLLPFLLFGGAVAVQVGVVTGGDVASLEQLTAALPGAAGQALVLAVPALVLGLPVAFLMVRRTRVTLTREELRVEIQRLLGSRVVAIPCAQLEELHISARPEAEVSAGYGDAAVVARSDAHSVAFGAGLRHDELVWLLGTLLRHLE